MKLRLTQVDRLVLQSLYQIQNQLVKIGRELDTISEQEEQEMLDLTALQEAVDANTAVDQQVVAELQRVDEKVGELEQVIADGGSVTPEQLEALRSQIQTSTDSVSTAITASSSVGQDSEPTA